MIMLRFCLFLFAMIAPLSAQELDSVVQEAQRQMQAAPSAQAVPQAQTATQATISPGPTHHLQRELKPEELDQYEEELQTSELEEQEAQLEQIEQEEQTSGAQTQTVVIKRKPQRSALHAELVQFTKWKRQFKQHMPEWMGQRIFMFRNGQWLGLAILILLAFIIERIARHYLGAFAKRLLRDKSFVLSKGNQRTLTFPMGIIVFAGVWGLGVRGLELPPTILAFFLRISYVLFTVGIVLSAYHIVDVFSLLFEQKAMETENKFDDILVPLLRKSAKFIVVCFGIVLVGDSLSLDMKSIIAGLGIGGLAFALAAKDTLGNVFGSLTVLLDRPFLIGDAVKIGGNIEGTVEEVGLRSTRIRTSYDSVITLPNGLLTNTHIDNYGQRRYRRFVTKLSLSYDTDPAKLEAFCNGVRELINHHPFTRKDQYHVYFNDFATNSLDVQLDIFWEVPDLSKELSQRHQLLMQILELAKSQGLQFAVPLIPNATTAKA